MKLTSVHKQQYDHCITVGYLAFIYKVLKNILYMYIYILYIQYNVELLVEGKIMFEYNRNVE